MTLLILLGILAYRLCMLCWLRQSSPNFLHNALQIFGVYNLRYASLYANSFYSSQNILIMLRSELWAGHGKVQMELSRFHSLALADT